MRCRTSVREIDSFAFGARFSFLANTRTINYLEKRTLWQRIFRLASDEFLASASCSFCNPLHSQKIECRESMAFRPLSSYYNTALTIISTLERELEDLLSFSYFPPFFLRFGSLQFVWGSGRPAFPMGLIPFVEVYSKFLPPLPM